jgi:hypothetical protein
MMEKNQLLIRGEISEMQIQVLDREFGNSGFEIVKYSKHGATISGIHDFLHLIFDDLRPISFARDYILGKMLDTTYTALKGVVTRLLEKQKVVKTLTILLEYQKKDGASVFIHFSAEEEKFHILIKEVYGGLTLDFFEGIQNGKTVIIALDPQDKLLIRVI